MSRCGVNARYRPRARRIGSRCFSSRQTAVERLEERRLLTNDVLQFALVSDRAGQALLQDPNLVNPWGVAQADGTDLWISDNARSVATHYAGDVMHSPFAEFSPVVNVPGGSPTGVVFNNTSDFTVSAGGASGPATFLFAGNNGKISGWNANVPAFPSTAAQSEVNGGAGENFTGLAVAQATNGQNLIYAADFHNGRIDVFDTTFQSVTLSGSFADPSLPAGYAPFNIQQFNGRLYVTYAVQDGQREHDVPGAGNGRLDIFDTNGNLLGKLPDNAASMLNSPWGMAIAPGGFGSLSGDLLVANSGDGHINGFNLGTNLFDGTVLDTSGNPLTIDGLRGITFGNGTSAGDTNALFFTAGPNSHSHGLFGALVSADGNPLDSIGTAFSANVGAPFNGVVATFANSNLSAAPGSFPVTINWGDGASSPGTVTSLGAGRFNVLGSHTYTSSRTFNVTATISDAQNDRTVATSTAQVGAGGSPLSVAAANLNGTEGGAFAGTVATFTDGDGNTSAGVYSATVRWGDGTTSTGTVTAAGGGFSVVATHTYTQEGTYTLTVIVSDNDGTSGTGTSTVHEADANLSASGNSLNLTEASTFTGAVATFTDANPNATAGDFTATIRWGDGTTTQGTVSSTGGGFQVTGQHNYTDEGTFPTVIAVNDAGTASITTTGTASISESDALSGQLNVATRTEGATISSVVATFSDTNHTTAAGDFSAAIDWGDGITTSGAVSGSGGAFSVSGTHAYADEGSFPLRVTLTEDAPGTASSTLSGTINAVEGDTLTSVATNPAPTEGQTFTGAVAGFSDTNLLAAAADFTATIVWGDGTTTTGTISGSAGNFLVGGNHAYSEEGAPPASVAVNEDSPGTASLATNVPVIVMDAAIQVTGTSLSLSEGSPFSGSVGTLSDADPNAVATDFTATLDWGDGTTGSGTVVANGQGGFSIVGQHTYSEGGLLTMIVNARDVGSSANGSLTSVTVNDFALAGSSSLTLSGSEGTAFSGKVATFTDADPDGGTASEYTATVAWGDGAQTPGTVTGSAGHYTVSDSHTFTDESSGISVSIRDAGGAAVTVNSSANITDTDVLTGRGATLSTTEGKAISGAVATFTDTNTSNSASDFTASVQWGDGQSSAGTVTTSGDGTFTALASHTYAEEAAGLRLSVVIADDGGGSATITATGTADVADAALTANATTIHSQPGAALNSAVVATFTDVAGPEPAGNYTATIDWGDGTSVIPGAVIAASGGAFQVLGDHTYTDAGNHSIKVTIHDDGGAQAQVTSSFIFGDANARFVAAAFLDVLGRAVDPPSLTFWDQLLDGGQSRTVVANLIDHSAEYYAHVIITPAYLRFLGRAPDDLGLGFWVDQMRQHGLTDERLEAGFIGSSEFYQHAGGTDKLWVDAMYQDLLGRPADSDGETYWVGQLAHAAKRSDVAFGFAASLERERQRVSDDYMHYLGRLPEQTGIDFWVNQFAHGVTNENVITGFVASDEYFRVHAG